VVTEAVPELEVRMWKQFIGYGSYHYVDASGREGDWFPIGLTNNKGYVSLYMWPATSRATWPRPTPIAWAR
jgi:hypothetical protein